MPAMGVAPSIQPGLKRPSPFRMESSGLSRERIGTEMRKLVTAGGAVAALSIMDETGHSCSDPAGWQCSGPSCDHDRFVGGGMACHSALRRVSPGLPPIGRRLPGRCACRGGRDKRIEAIVHWGDRLAARMDEATVRLVVVRAGNEVASAALLFAAGRTRMRSEDRSRSRRPRFPPPGIAGDGRPSYGGRLCAGTGARCRTAPPRGSLDRRRLPGRVQTRPLRRVCRAFRSPAEIFWIFSGVRSVHDGFFDRLDNR